MYNFYGEKIVHENNGSNDISNTEASIHALIEADERNLFYKSLLLDCGRKYFSKNNIKALIDKLSTNGLNQIVLHFSDMEGFRFSLDDMIVTTTYGSYDLTDSVGDNSGAQEGYLTQADMDDITAYAKSKNIEVVGEFDMPGHMSAILKNHPQLRKTTRDLDTSNPEAVEFAYALLRKYAIYFKNRGSKYFSFGADEVHEQDANDLIEFNNGACQVIASCGLIPRMWNDCIKLGGKHCNSAVQVNYWTHKQEVAVNLINNGFTLINSGVACYVVPNGNIVGDSFYNQRLNSISNFNPTDFQSSGKGIPSGAQMCCWNDNNKSYGDDNGDGVVALLDGLISAFSNRLSQLGY